MLRFDGVHSMSPVAEMILATIRSLYPMLNGLFFYVDSSIRLLLEEPVLFQLHSFYHISRHRFHPSDGVRGDLAATRRLHLRRETYWQVLLEFTVLLKSFLAC